MLNADSIKLGIIEKYDLINHYGISSESEFSFTKVFDTYRKNVSFRKTEYMAVIIEVLDKDPVMAANIANDIAALLDSTMHNLQRQRAKIAYEIVGSELLSLKQEISAIEDSLNIIRGLGVIDYISQAEAYHQAHANALLRNDRSAAKALENRLKIISDYGGAYVSLSQILENQLENLSAFKVIYNEARVNYQKEMPVKFLLDKAYPAERKSYPVRWLIVVVGTFSGFLLSFFVFLIIDTVKSKLD